MEAASYMPCAYVVSKDVHATSVSVCRVIVPANA